MTNIYYGPAAFGLEIIGEVDYNKADYGFDLVVVWKRADGTLVWAADSGCSCPSPFEDQSADTLNPIETLQSYLDGAGMNSDAVALLEKVWQHS